MTSPFDTAADLVCPRSPRLAWHTLQFGTMQFQLRTLFVVVGIAGVLSLLIFTEDTRAAVMLGSVAGGLLFGILGRKRFPRLAFNVLVITGLVFLYFLFDGILISLRPIVLRAADEGDKVHEKYFCLQDMPEMTVRNIVVAEGTFPKGTLLVGKLYLVENGSVRDLNGFSATRSPNRIGEAHWMTMRMTMALADAPQSKGRITQLGVVGMTRGGGNSGGPAVHDIQVSSRQAFPGRMSRFHGRIVYVEGDAPATVTLDMTMAEFAKANHGNYIVVFAGLNIP